MGDDNGQDRGTPDSIEAWDLAKAARRYEVGRGLLFSGHRSPTTQGNDEANGHVDTTRCWRRNTPVGPVRRDVPVVSACGCIGLRQLVVRDP
jgi:hypothetical protein